MKKKSVLFSAIAMLVVSVITLTTATFAWFTTASNPTLAQIEVGVSKGGGLTISKTVDAGFGEVLSIDDVKAALKASTGYFDPYLTPGTTKQNPVTPTAASISTGKKLQLASDTKNIAFQNEKAEANTKDVIKMSVYLKATQDMKVYIDVGAKGSQEGATLITRNNNNLKKSIRIAYVAFDSTGTTIVTSSAPKLYTAEATITQTSTYTVDTKAEIATPEFCGIELFDTKVIAGAAATVYKVDIYAWIEGTDENCIDSNSGGTFSMKTAFRGVVAA